MGIRSPIQYKEYRCPCGKLLFKGLLIDSTVEIKCKNCGNLTKITGQAGSPLICLVSPCPYRVHARENPN